jgi:hypothetical protein
MRKHRSGAPPVQPPAGNSGTWTTKIEIANEIREGMAKFRKGKPVSFPTRRWPSDRP